MAAANNTSNSLNASARTIINGFEPITAIDIECMSHIAYEQVNAMGAIFRTISRLTQDAEVIALCKHGALQADLQGNDIDCIRERVVKAGMVGCLREESEVHHA